MPWELNANNDPVWTGDPPEEDDVGVLVAEKLDDGVSSVTAEQARDHIDDTTNPHSVTHAQVSPAEVDPTSTNTDRTKHVSNNDAKGWEDHKDSTSNPHSVTKTQVGLGNVTNDQQVPKSGGTFTGTVDAPTLQEGGSDLDTLYALLSGATFTGPIHTEANTLSVARGQGASPAGVGFFVGGGAGASDNPYIRWSGTRWQLWQDYAGGALADVDASEMRLGGDLVAEYGSNSNGRYVRFYNGVQVCWDRRNLERIATSTLRDTWTYPAAFSNAGVAVVGTFIHVSSNITPSITELREVDTQSPDATDVLVSLRRISGMTDFASGDTALVSVVAVGEWS